MSRNSLDDGIVRVGWMVRESKVGDAETVVFRDAKAFETWLDERVGLQAGIWLKIAKQASGVPSITSDEAVDVGLCFGWISGQRRSLDDTYYLQKYVPRRPLSRWSQVNVDKVAALVATERMRPPGIAEVDAAQADGRWAAAYESQRNATVPPDLAAALEANPHAQRVFTESTKTEQYAAILKLATARTAVVRARQLRRIIDALDGSAP